VIVAVVESAVESVVVLALRAVSAVAIVAVAASQNVEETVAVETVVHNVP
jgi:hypothetical protein